MNAGVDITTDLEALEEIAAQATRRVNEAAPRRGGKGYAFNLSPNLEHTHVPHPPKPAKATTEPPAIESTSLPIGFSATVVTSYTELMSAIQAQVGALGLKLTDFDDLAGFPAGLSGKVFGLLQVKRLGPEKMFDALCAAGLRLRVEVDPDQEAKMRIRIAENYLPRQANQARNNNHASAISSQVLSRAFGHVLREARKKRWAGTTKAERSEHARTIANARWRRHRKRSKAAEKAARTRKDRLALIPEVSP